MGFFYRAGSRPLQVADLTLAVEIERRGRVAPGQPVDEVFIAFDGDADAQTFGPLVLELGLVALVSRGAALEEWEPAS